MSADYSRLTRIEQWVATLLIQGRLVTEENMVHATDAISRDGITFREAIVSGKYITDETYSTFLSMATRTPLVNLGNVAISEEVMRLIPQMRRGNTKPFLSR